MSEKQALRLFEEKENEWYLPIIDVIGILARSFQPPKYWDDLRCELILKGSQLSENIGQLKMQSSDGKKHRTDVGDIKQIFRRIQSIPSANAGSFKLRLAQWREVRLQKIEPPELAKEPMENLGEQKGSSKKNQNLGDNMTALKLIFTLLQESVASKISQQEKSETLIKNKKPL